MSVVPVEKIWRHQVLQRHRDPKFQIAWIRQVIILFGARGDSVVILGLLAAIEREIPNLDVDGSGGEPHETESGTLVRPMSRPTRDSDTLVRPISRSSQNNQPPPRPMQPKVMNQSNIGQGEPTPPPRDHRKPTVSPPAPPMPVQPANQITPDVPARPSRPRTNSQSDNSQKQRPPKPPPPNPGTYQSKINSKMLSNKTNFSPSNKAKWSHSNTKGSYGRRSFKNIQWLSPKYKLRDLLDTSRNE